MKGRPQYRFLSYIFRNSQEYEKRKARPFRPPMTTIAELHATIPNHLLHKSTALAVYHVARDVFFVTAFYSIATRIDSLSVSVARYFLCSPYLARVVQGILWLTYWWWQSIAFAGCWCLAHEFGHGSLSPYRWVNHLFGFALHTFLLVPYYAWRSTHRAHHKATGSMERDENYVPYTRSSFKLPQQSKARLLDYHDILEETPLYTLFRMILMQLFGWHVYIFCNSMGSPVYPKGTNHFLPSSLLFKTHERKLIIVSNLGLLFMFATLSYYMSRVGVATLFRMYIIPYLLCHHWIVMLTFLHHTDPTLPHYRGKSWSFLRGAVATIDRPLLGWIGRFFLHNISHDHVAHHLFSNIPFYNQPEVTKYLKEVLKDDYNYDSTNSFYALYRSFTECCFVEDEGDIVFYKNKHGEAQRTLEGKLN